MEFYIQTCICSYWTHQDFLTLVSNYLARTYTKTLPKHYPNTTQTLPKHYPNTTQTLPKHYPSTTQTLPKHYPNITQTLLQYKHITLLIVLKFTLALPFACRRLVTADDNDNGKVCVCHRWKRNRFV
jgi:hypothetical protein